MPCKRNREHTLRTRDLPASGQVSLSDDAFPNLKSPRSTPHRRWLNATGRLQTSRARTRSAAVACPWKPFAASINPRATTTAAPIRNILQGCCNNAVFSSGVFAGNAAMGVTLCAGCALIALGPASAVFLVVVAPHADLVIRCILRCSRCCRCVLPAAALDGFLHVRLSVS